MTGMAAPKPKNNTPPPKKKLTPEERLERDYRAACKAAGWAQWTVFYRDRAEYYHKAEAKFLALDHYKDSDEQAAFCAAEARKAETEGCEAAFQAAKAQVAAAVTSNDYLMAAQSLERITEHPDARRAADACLAKCDRLHRRNRLLTLILALVCCLLIAGGAAVAKLDAVQYSVASYYMGHEDYANALTWYLRARDYGDSEEQIALCRYQRGIQFYQEGKYSSAYDKFRLLNGYQDADAWLADSVRAMLVQCQPGGTLSFGRLEGDKKAKWYVLDNDGQTVTLIADFYLQHAYHDSGDAVTWADCSLRSWLNSDFLSDTFTDAEQALLAEAALKNEPNSVYGTEGGPDTADRAYVLSEQEAKTYSDILFAKDENGKPLDTLKAAGLGWWLRTPGAASDGAAFINSSSAMVLYGYENPSPLPQVRPVIRLSLSD